MPEKFYPLAVGVSLLTTLAAPVLTRHSDRVSTWLVARQPGLLKDDPLLAFLAAMPLACGSQPEARP